MRINPHRLRPLAITLPLNTYMIFYLAKVYRLPFENDRIRLVMILALGMLCVSYCSRVVVTKRVNGAYGIFASYFIYLSTMIVLREKSSTTALISCLFFPLVFLSSYSVLRKANDLGRVVRTQYAMLFCLGFLYFCIRLIAGRNDGLTVNSVYYQVLLLPFILSIDNPTAKRFAIVFLVGMVLLSMKRTAFVATLVSLSVYLITQKQGLLSRSPSATLSKAALVSVILTILTAINSFVNARLGTDIFDRILSIVGDEGSGRLSIAHTIIGRFASSRFDQILIGHGYNATSLYADRLTAHNDFLEILFDFGVFGLLVYLGLYLALIKYSFIFKRNDYRYVASFNASIALFLIVSMFSHLIFVPTYVGYLSLFWSFCIADYEMHRIK